MKKKKIITVIAAVAVVASLALGSLAFFTSKETVKNSFTTVAQGKEDKGGDAGIDINENFDENQAKNMVPGDTVNKDVQVDSTASYPQFIRVKLDPNWVDLKGNINENLNKTDKDSINLNCVNLTDTITDNKWFKSGDYYYYIAAVQPKGQAGDTTARLLDSVTLASNTEEAVLGNGFTVDVTAESVQASNDAYTTWEGIPQNVIDKLKTLQQNKTEANTTTAK
ncbi:MAG: BsaA family SipW-dependent biofilm matrix protein [Clostridium sp.]|uniref:BsaA family SipW-dependent biofilm matrix protein n=1 Tax=Clostridium sp. TaxID=1506 RepID=UPI003F2A7B5C